MRKNYGFSLNSRNIDTRSDFFIPKAWLTFTNLKQMFVKAPIFYYFYQKYYIFVKIDISRYAISRILS